MPRKRFTNEQIASALRQAESCATVDEVIRIGARLGFTAILPLTHGAQVSPALPRNGR